MKPNAEFRTRTSANKNTFLQKKSQILYDEVLYLKSFLFGHKRSSFAGAALVWIGRVLEPSNFLLSLLLLEEFSNLGIFSG